MRTAPQDPRNRRQVATWLLACCGMVVVMVILGGLTRLTGSGLSMVEWQPFTLLPPLSEAQWQETFAKYRASPEFMLVNSHMSLADFKGIFWLEYIHRLWGRLIGVVFLLPFLWFLARGMIEKRLAPRLAAIFVLGGLQGAVGWFMVQSGLVDRPEVSHYRLAAHLVLALLILAMMLWLALDLLVPPQGRRSDAPAGPRHALGGLLALSSVTILWGAFVAGLDAGRIYNTFPLMNGDLLPPEAFARAPWWINLFETIAAVQFTHRLLALSLVAAVIAVWALTPREGMPRGLRLVLDLLPFAALAQAGLGIATLLMVVPVGLAAAHQAGAVVLFLLLLTGLNLSGKVTRRSAVLREGIGTGIPNG